MCRGRGSNPHDGYPPRDFKADLSTRGALGREVISRASVFLKLGAVGRFWVIRYGRGDSAVTATMTTRKQVGTMRLASRQMCGVSVPASDGAT
jgi:hypothetical protein